MRIHKLLRQLREDYSHVEVMPSQERTEIDFTELTPREIAALQSVGVEVPQEAVKKAETITPASKDGEVGQEEESYQAGIPSEPDYRARLKYNPSHLDKIGQEHQEAKAKAEKEALKSARQKIKSTDQRRRQEISDARNELNAELERKAKQSWADAAALWMSKSKR